MDNVFDRRERTLYVWMLQKSITDDDLYNMFSEAGPIEKVVFKETSDDTPQHALVVFRNVESVAYAMSTFQGFLLHGETINMRPLRESSHQISPPSSVSHFGRSRGWSTGPLSGINDDFFRGDFSDSDSVFASSRPVTTTKPMYSNRELALNWDKFSRPSVSPTNSPSNGSVFHIPGLLAGKFPEYRSISSSADNWTSPNTPDLLSPPASAGFLGLNRNGESHVQRSAFPFFGDETLKSNIPNVGHPIGYERDRKAMSASSNSRKNSGNSEESNYPFPCHPLISSRDGDHSYCIGHERRMPWQAFNSNSRKFNNFIPRKGHMYDVDDGDGFARWAASTRDLDSHRGPAHF